MLDKHIQERFNRYTRNMKAEIPAIGDVLKDVLDKGERHGKAKPKSNNGLDGDNGKEYRVRSPTRSERMNRALKELRPAAFKIHALIWEWRGAPARGILPFFTIRSLEKFCNLTRPTVRKAFDELTIKGWIIRSDYNCHHKNALYRLVPVRKIPRPDSNLGEAPR